MENKKEVNAIAKRSYERQTQRSTKTGKAHTGRKEADHIYKPYRQQGGLCIEYFHTAPAGLNLYAGSGEHKNGKIKACQTGSGYDMDIIPSDLATCGEEAKDLQSRNERMFLLTFLVVNLADDKSLYHQMYAQK